MKQFNIGEWSEFYVLLKLLCDGQLYCADKDLNRIDDWYYPVKKILHESQDNNPIAYELFSDDDIIKITYLDSISEFSSKQMLIDAINKLLVELKSKNKGNRAFPFLDQIMAELKQPKLKASSKTKRDITVVVEDLRLNLDQEVGFSIKSKLGSPSTLFNSSQATNFEFKILNYENLTASQKSELDLLVEGGVDETGRKRKKEIKRLVKTLLNMGCDLELSKVCNETFKRNLKIIDSLLDRIMSEYLIGYYAEEGSNIADLGPFVASRDKCNFETEDLEGFYEFKIKEFLLASALGMTAKDQWNGQIDVTGGYIIVKEDGDLVCFHIYNWNDFRDYLLSNTKFDTPSSTRHKFGKIYRDSNNQAMLRLNLQIRFIH